MAGTSLQAHGYLAREKQSFPLLVNLLHPIRVNERERISLYQQLANSRGPIHGDIASRVRSAGRKVDSDSLVIQQSEAAGGYSSIFINTVASAIAAEFYRFLAVLCLPVANSPCVALRFTGDKKMQDTKENGDMERPESVSRSL